jgi:hypothetical protein
MGNRLNSFFFLLVLIDDNFGNFHRLVRITNFPVSICSFQKLKEYILGLVYLRFNRGVNNPIYAHQPKKDNSAYFNLQNELNYTRLYHLQNVTHHFSLQILARTHAHPAGTGCHPRRARSSTQLASKIQRRPAHRMAGASHTHCPHPAGQISPAPMPRSIPPSNERPTVQSLTAATAQRKKENLMVQSQTRS